MNLVLYFRVSTLGQETDGQSLQNQERRARAFAQREGHTILREYRESASAKTVAGRAQFSRMIAELATVKPEVVVIDTLDRFTRSLREGLNLLEEFKGRGVGLLPLDWGRVLNVDDTRDWDAVTSEFKLAEHANRKHSDRMRRSYQGRDERGATKTNHCPLGVRKVGDALEQDPQTAWIVTEVDRRALEGQTLRAMAAWAKSVGAWTTSKGVREALRNRRYVAAGLRTPQTQVALEGIIARLAERYGRQTRDHAHEFAGVFACGRCLDAGVPRPLMASKWLNRSSTTAVFCDRARHAPLFVNTNRGPEQRWRAFLEMLGEPEFADEWAARSRPQPKAQGLQRKLAAIDQREAEMKRRRDRAFALLGDVEPGVVRQARKALADIDGDEQSLHVERQAILGALAAEPLEQMSGDDLRALVAHTLEIYDALAIAERAEMSRRLCAALGSHPRIDREGRNWSTVRITWPEVEGVSRRASRRLSSARG